MGKARDNLQEKVNRKHAISEENIVIDSADG